MRRQFGLRSVLVAMGIVGVLLTIGVRLRNRQLDRDDSVRKLREHGVVATYVARPSLPEWLAGAAHCLGLAESIDSLQGPASAKACRLVSRVGSVRQLTLHGPLTADDFVQLGAVPGLRSLSIHNARVAARDFEALATLASLNELSLNGSSLEEGALAKLATFPKLRVVDLSLTNVSDATVAELAGLVQVEGLDLTDTSVTDAGIVSLAPLTKLRVLGTPDAVTPAGLAKLFCTLQGRPLDKAPGLAGLSKPTHFSLEGPIADEFLAYLQPYVKQLEQIEFPSAALTGAGVAELLRFPQLRTLTLGRPRGASSFAGASRLERLELVDLNDDAAITLEGLPALQELALRGAEFSGVRCKFDPATLPALQTLDLTASGSPGANSAVNDAFLLRVSALHQLHRLDLTNTQATDACLVHLATLPVLESLQLRGTKISAAALPTLGQMTRLRYLGLSRTRLDGASIAPLLQLKRLTELGLVNAGVDDACHRALIQGLPNCSVLR